MKSASITTTVILIRHGETLWNREHRIQGHLDSPLTAEGIAQAEACGKRLQAESFDFVVASDLGRVRHTAHLLLAGRALPVSFDASLRERSFGAAEGRPLAEIDRRYPGMIGEAGLVESALTLPGGESRSEFQARVKSAITGLASAHSGQRLLVVTHGGVLRAVYRWLNALPLNDAQKLSVPNTAYNRILFEHGQWKMDVWGDTTHLAVSTSGGV